MQPLFFKFDMDNNTLGLLKEIASKEGLEGGEIIFRGELDKNLNFHGMLNKFSIKKNETELNLIVKVAEKDFVTRSVQKTEEKFWNEVFFYTQILPNLQRYGEVKVPKLYGSSLEKGNEVLILEDLSHRYKTMDFKTGFDEDHLKLVLNTLAKLHKASLAWKDEEPNQFLITNGLRESIFMNHENPHSIKILQIMLKGAATVAANHARKLGDKYFKKGITFAEQAYDEMLSWVDSSLSEPYNVLTHGDSWGNNYMFSYYKGKPVDVMIVDWQMARIGSPLLDVSEFIFSTSNEAALLNVENFYHFYSSKMSIPIESWRIHKKRYSRFGYMMAAMILIFATAETEVPVDRIMSDILETSNFNFELNAQMSTRVARMVKAVCELDII